MIKNCVYYFENTHIDSKLTKQKMMHLSMNREPVYAEKFQKAATYVFASISFSILCSSASPRFIVRVRSCSEIPKCEQAMRMVT